MKHALAASLLGLGLLSQLHAQVSVGGNPMSALLGIDRSNIPTAFTPHFTAPANIPVGRERVPHDAQLLDLDLTVDNAGSWTTLPSGDRIWRLRITSPNALGTELYFADLQLPNGSSLYLYDDNGEQVLGGFTPANNKAHGVFSTARINGENCIVEYFEPHEALGSSPFHISHLAHTYRDIEDELRADDCEVDAICSPESDNLTSQRDAVVRIRVVDDLGQIGYCTGSLINNVRQDCKTYFLTANHCGTEAEVDSAHFQLWKFYFRYQRTTCGSGTASANKIMTGCIKRGTSNDNGGATGSDFLLLEGDPDIPTTFNPYWEGWDANNVTASGAKCIHHPNGDEKKISTVNGNTINSTWQGTSGTHWRVTWAGTTNGHGVTEGGSSGSPLFNSIGRAVGTLTGGGSYCNSVVPGGENQPDYFGKLSYHWQSNAGATSKKLKTWLDPDNTGTLTLNGSSNPCASSGINGTTAIEGLLVLAPNPAVDDLRISLPLTTKVDAIVVTDPAGRIVANIATNNRITLNVNVGGWAPGAYLVQAISAGAVVSTARFNVAR